MLYEADYNIFSAAPSFCKLSLINSVLKKNLTVPAKRTFFSSLGNEKDVYYINRAQKYFRVGVLTGWGQRWVFRLCQTCYLRIMQWSGLNSDIVP